MDSYIFLRFLTSGEPLASIGVEHFEFCVPNIFIFAPGTLFFVSNSLIVAPHFVSGCDVLTGVGDNKVHERLGRPF